MDDIEPKNPLVDANGLATVYFLLWVQVLVATINDLEARIAALEP